MAGRHHLPRHRRRDHLGGGPDPRRRRGRRVAVVLPYGSRVATSRINFRLLSRDALTHEKRLSIVAGGPGDAGARRVGGAAGLRVGRRVRVVGGGAPPGRDGRRHGRRRRRRCGRGCGRPGAAAAAPAGTTGQVADGAAPKAPASPRAGARPRKAAAAKAAASAASAEPAAAPPQASFQQTLDDAEAAELAAAAAALQAEARTQATPADWSARRAEPLPPPDGPAPRTATVTRSTGTASGAGSGGGPRTPLLVGGLVVGSWSSSWPSGPTCSCRRRRSSSPRRRRPSARSR